MEEVYTPTKSLDREDIFHAADVDLPAVYVPTPIDNSAAPTSTQNQEDQTTRQKYGAGNASSQSNPAIRIVKRKPKLKPDMLENSSSTNASNKRRATENGEDPAIAALRTFPTKGILRSAQQPSRGLAISFADARDFPLVQIKEIERIAAIHSNVHDFRCSEKNEGADLGHALDDIEDFEWGLLKVTNAKIKNSVMAESAKRELKRLEDAGIMRGATFGIYTLKCIPELNDMAAVDMASSKPVIIPTTSIPTEPAKVNALRDLPLPGRNRISGQKFSYSTNDGVSAGIQKETPVIQQVFQESDPVIENNYYTASTSEEESVSQTSSSAELPPNLKIMLEKLKQQGLLSKEKLELPIPTPVDPLITAIHTAQQMMTEQSGGNTYSSEDYTGDDCGYVATFATPEMMAQERKQNSRNSEGWTQSGWKIHEPCVYFINRPNGCNRGDQCRFIHDDELRRKTQAELPPRGYHRDAFRGGDRRGRTGFRGNFHNNFSSQQDLQNGGPRQDGKRVTRFHDYDGNCGGRFNSQRGGYMPRGSRFDKKADGNVNPSQLPPSYNKPPPNFHQLPFQHNEQAQTPTHPPPMHMKHDHYTGSPHEQDSSDRDATTVEDGVSPQKRQRMSRFDQRVEDAPIVDLELRQQRRSRFDDRPHRSRFDQPSHQS